MLTTLRAATPEDMDFLYKVYASTRVEELAPLGWDAAQQETFLTSQFNAQHTYYHAMWPAADYQIIMLNDQPIGRLYVRRSHDMLVLMDIALLPDYRNQGIGTGYLKAVLAEGSQAKLPVRLHVEQYNPAFRLYTRFGFYKIGENGVYFEMEWRDHAG